jgi:lipopolysaccharide/colanic/teichoic acid biosynthesis glycosyltransferase
MQLTIAVLTTLAVVVAALTPLYKPRPRRILNVVYHAERRIATAGLALAALGYFDWTYRLPRPTLIVTIGILMLVVPTWFVTIRRRPSTDPGRAVIIGDDHEEMGRILESLDTEILGYVAPPFDAPTAETVTSPAPSRAEGDAVPTSTVADGSGLASNGGSTMQLPYIGGLSRLETVLVENDVDTAVFAFDQTDRQEFFGVLATCHEHGVDAKIRREKADSVLVSNDPGREVVDVDVDPWDWQDRVVKRAFDVAFSSAGLIATAPLIALIAIAIKLEDQGPVLYSQERTAEFGETFTVYKFRSMVPDSEDTQPGEDDSRVTRVGRVLRESHFDEIPQLWSILVGDMSVVGPRAVWTDEEHLLERVVDAWRQRWFVKPGLTGLAQINDATSEDPERKLRYDVEYIRRQSLRFDVAIVVRQLWQALEDLIHVVISGRS